MNNKLQQEAFRLIELIYAATQDVQYWPIFVHDLAKIIDGKSDLLCLTDHRPDVPENKILMCATCGQADQCLHAVLLGVELGLLRLLGPHVVRAVQMRQHIDAASSDKELLRGLLNCWSAGVVVVDEHGSFLTMNAQAEHLLAGRNVGVKHNRIELANSADTTRLNKLIADTMRLKKYRMVSGMLNTPLPNGDMLKILVVPLVAQAADSRAPIQGRAALFMCIPGMLHLTCQQVSACYGLTHAESSLVIKLVDGMDVGEAAQALSITYSTARTYLKQIFIKLGIKRQSELVLCILTGVLGCLPQDSTLNNFRTVRR